MCIYKYLQKEVKMLFKELFLSESSNNLRYIVSINKELHSFIKRKLRDIGYRVDWEGSKMVVHPHKEDKVNKFQDKLYGIVTKAFEEGDKEVVKFVGSNKEDDLINSDLDIEVVAEYK